MKSTSSKFGVALLLTTLILIATTIAHWSSGSDMRVDTVRSSEERLDMFNADPSPENCSRAEWAMNSERTLAVATCTQVTSAGNGLNKYDYLYSTEALSKIDGDWVRATITSSKVTFSEHAEVDSKESPGRDLWVETITAR